jgi:hypothetical protein
MRNILLPLDAFINLNESDSKAQENRASHASKLLPDTLRCFTEHVDSQCTTSGF